MRKKHQACQAVEVFIHSLCQTAVDLRRMHSHPISAAHKCMRHAMCSYKNEKPGDGNGNEEKKKLVQHQRRRSSSMTKSNRNTTRPFSADVYFRLPLQRRTKNEMCSRWCCRRRLHCTYAHRPNARTHRYGAVRATQRPVSVEHRSLVRVHTRAMQQMCLVERTNNVHAVVWQQRLVVCD